jgi:hypothetical protein
MPRMDPVAALVLAIGSLACLQVAALNLRGDARRSTRRPAAARPRR